MKTIHIEGKANEIDILDSLSDNYEIDASFCFDEESEDVIKNVFFRFYECDSVCTLEEAMKGHLRQSFGDLTLTGQEYGYSEFTVEGFNIESAKLGGHELNHIINYKEDKYLHILIDVIK